MGKKTPLSHKLCALFRSLNSKPQLRSQVQFKYFTSFSKTTLLQRETFLTMFCTTNSYPSLVTKLGFMLTIILGNYQCASKYLTYIFHSAFHHSQRNNHICSYRMTQTGSRNLHSHMGSLDMGSPLST